MVWCHQMVINLNNKESVGPMDISQLKHKREKSGTKCEIGEERRRASFNLCLSNI